MREVVAMERSAARARSGCLVLVTDGGDGQNRTALAAVQALAVAGYEPVVTVSGRDSLAASSKYCRAAVRVPVVTAAGYAAAVRAELRTRPYLAVLPASDAALLALGADGAELVDKVTLDERARAAGLEVPRGRVFASTRDLVAQAGDLEYPVVVKAVQKTWGRRPARLAERPEELEADPEDSDGPVVVQPFVDAAMHAVSGVVEDGRLVAAVHQRYLRLWPSPCGDSCAAVTTVPDPELERAVEVLLAGYTGVFQVELVGRHLVDVNPRVYASLPLAVAAGANLPAVYCDLLRGRRQRQVLRARPGVRYCWWEGDLRHLAWRWRRGEASAVDVLSAVAADARCPAPAGLDLAPTAVRLRHVRRRLLGRHT